MCRPIASRPAASRVVSPDVELRSTFALLRRNGKFLYISDLVNWREYAYTLFREPLGERVPLTETLRRAGQADIRGKVDEVDALFRAK